MSQHPVGSPEWLAAATPEEIRDATLRGELGDLLTTLNGGQTQGAPALRSWARTSPWAEAQPEPEGEGEGDEGKNDAGEDA
jgi:hypothetical protein